MHFIFYTGMELILHNFCTDNTLHYTVLYKTVMFSEKITSHFTCIKMSVNLERYKVYECWVIVSTFEMNYCMHSKTKTVKTAICEHFLIL